MLIILQILENGHLPGEKGLTIQQIIADKAYNKKPPF